jgi:hypothetical protein
MRSLRLALTMVLALTLCMAPLRSCGPCAVVQLKDDPDGAALERTIPGASLAQPLATPFAIVPKKLWGAVERTLHGLPMAETLAHDLTVYRYWGGTSAESGSPWFTPTRFENVSATRFSLALPANNTAQHVTVFTIPRGATILRGIAASMTGEPGFGPEAVGGGTQIYLPDPGCAVKTGPLP